jgi:hypothetical protein
MQTRPRLLNACIDDCTSSSFAIMHRMLLRYIKSAIVLALQST